MPAVLVPVIAWAGAALGGAAGAFVIMNAAAIATGVLLVGTVALSQYQKRKAERAARAQFDAAQVDRLANVPSTVAPRELVLGRLRKGGTVFFRSSVGQYKEKFFVCIAIAAHEIDAYERIYFNDVPMDFVGDTVVTAPYGRIVTASMPPVPPVRGLGGAGATDGGFPLTASATALPQVPLAGSMSVFRTRVIEGQQINEPVAFTLAGNVLTIAYDPSWTYSAAYQYQSMESKARVRTYLGTPGQQADTRMQELFPGVWTADHRAVGIAYIVCEFDYDETAFPSGIPTVTALVRGARVYDPRYGFAHFTENPALLMRHVLLHPQFGKRTALTAAEDARISAAANACETFVSYTGAGVQTAYRAATVIPFGAAARDAFDDLSQAMGGQWAYAAGEIFVRAGIYQAPVLALNDNDLAVVQRSTDGGTSQSPITISTHRARNEKVNTILARIWDQAANYVQSPINPFRADALVAADGAELAQEVTMPAVFDAPQAYAITGIILRDSRDPLSVTLPFKLRAYPIELFDGVTLTLARYGWTSKEFQVLGRTFMPEGFVLLTLKETTAAIFQFGAPYLPAGYADNTGLPRPWDIIPPVITSIDSGENELVVQSDGTIVNAVRVTWAAVQDASVVNGGTIEVQYRRLVDGFWHSVVVPGGVNEAVFSGVADREVIYVRARSRSSIAVSDWGVQWSHVVEGKTALPPNIENLSISGSVLSWMLPRRVPDLAGFVFRFHYGNNLDWNSATPLHTGVLTESPYDLITRPGGVVTIMGKAIDTTGNVSLASANIVMNLGDPPIANVIEQWDFDALGWPYMPGEQSGWTLVGGNPSANALDSFYGTDDQSFYGEATDPFYEVGAYGQMVYVTGEVSVNSALAGSIMTLTSITQGVDLRIEYRLSGPGSFYGADNAALYEADADPFYGAAGPWQPWPGQLTAANDAYQFRVTIGAGTERGVLEGLILTIDAPDLEESIADVVIAGGGTAIPYAKPFTSIKTVQATLQANGSGAETVEVDKATPLVPVIRAFNSAHGAVAGATADIVIKGY